MTLPSKQQNWVGMNLPNVTSKEVALYKANELEKKLKNFSTKDDLLLMNSLLLRWANYLGIKKPEASELNTLANFIRENFPNFNATDLGECINLVATDSLDTDAQPYGQLSVVYVSKVLKAYQLHKSEIMFKVREKIQKIEQDRVIPPSDKERVANFKALLKMAKESVTKGEEYYDTGEVIYGFIKHNKLIQMTKELIADAMGHGNNVFRQKSISDSYKKVINDVAFTKLVKEDIVKRYAREYVTDLWLKQTDVEGILPKITIQMINY
jgi:hypothetical protein